MGAIDSLKSASLVTQSMVRQALLEAKTDPTKMPALQEAFEAKQQGQFEKPDQFLQVQQFVQDWACDKFELRANTDNRLPKPATITEARITKVQDVAREVVMNPPAPPVNPGRYRDPLHITGVAEPGATVEVYNASQAGRPVIASVTADATGKFRVELTDETKFLFGDQMGVVVKDSAGKASRPVIVPTEPYQVTNTTTTFRQWNGGPVVRTDTTSSMQALAPTTDHRDPFYQDGKVTKTPTEPRAAGEPWTMVVKGGDDAVEPNSTVTVRVGSEVFSTKVADDGTFALKLEGFTPGQLLKIEIRDVNGKGIDRPLQVPHVRNESARIAGGMFIAPTMNPPTGGREVVGAEPPWVAFKASEVTVPFGAVVIKNETTGDVFELTADDKGSINGAVGGISEFDVLNVATRDANGNFSEKTTPMVVFADKSYGGFLVPVDGLSGKAPKLDSVLEGIKGPPMDLFIKRGGGEVKDPRGPFLALPAVQGLPPYAQLAVVRDGAVVQTLRADAQGAIKGYLAGVSVGDRLDFRVLDAAGRRFGEEIVGFEVPGKGAQTKIKPENRHTPSEARAVKDCVDLVGTGTLDVEHAWVQPFSVGAQQNPPKAEEFKLHYAPLVFSGRPAQNVPQGVPQQAIEQLPAALAQKFGVASALQIQVQENNGTQVLNISSGTNNARICTVGVDYVVGNVNAGDFSAPLTAAHLPQITAGLKATLALVAAAYDQGKEPGDLVYDRAMSSAKTLLYVLDRFAAANPTLAADAKKAATDAMPADFPFELFGKERVPPDSQTKPLAAVTGKRTSTMSLIEARASTLGRVEKKPTPPSTGEINAPRVDLAAIMRGGQHNSQGAAVLRGRGTPGEVIQAFNVSAGKASLLGETLVGPDGRYELVAKSPTVVAGDLFGVMALSADGKQKSKLNVVPTDLYSFNGHDITSATPIAGATPDQRPPIVFTPGLTLANASYDAKGAVRAGGPFWTLSSADFAVEPFATVSVSAQKPDGTIVAVTARADDQGRFSLEFPHPARTTVTLNVTDRNGNGASAQLHTPGLSEASVVSGDRAAEAASGVVQMRFGNTTVKGVIVDSTLNKNNNLEISDADRADAFVDVIIRQKFVLQGPQGTGDQDVTFRVKVSPDEAKKLAIGKNDTLNLEGAVIEMLNFDANGSRSTSSRPQGPARIVDRDYPLVN